MVKKIHLLLFFVAAVFSTTNAQTQFIEINSSSAGWQDTKIKRSSNATDLNGNYNTSPYLDVVEWTWNGVVGSIYVLINFDLSVLPVESDIQTAYLSLYLAPETIFNKNASASSSSEFAIKRIISPWQSSTVTWNTKPTVTEVNTVIVKDNHQNYARIDVTNLIIDMMRNRSNSYGIMLMCPVHQKYRGLSFASSKHPNATLRPKLTITYVDPSNGNN